MINHFTRILKRFIRLANNRYEVPDYLFKQIDGILMDSERGRALLIDGLQDEKDYIEELLWKLS